MFMEMERMRHDTKLLPKSFIESNIIDYIENGYNLNYVHRLLQSGILRGNGKFADGFRLQGKSYLGFSIACNQTNLALDFLQKGANPQKLEIEATRSNNVSVKDYFYQDFLIEKKLPYFNQKRENSSLRLFSSLILSVEKNNQRILQDLIKHGAKPDIGLFYGNCDTKNFEISNHISPLGLAVLYNNPKMVSELLNLGANPWNGFLKNENISNEMKIDFIAPEDMANQLNYKEISTLIQNKIKSSNLQFDDRKQYDFFNHLINEGNRSRLKEKSSPVRSFQP
jgi:hypothetical protein